MKKCTKCGKSKRPEQFQKDRNKKDGLRSACAVCLNALKRSKREVVEEVLAGVEEILPEPPIEKSRSPIKIPISTDSVFQKLMEKYQAPFSISMYKNGTGRLQIHSDPQVTHKLQSIESVFDLV